MFEYELDVLEEISGQRKKITVHAYDLEDSETEMYWREHEFGLEEEDEYSFKIDSITATYIDYDNNDNEINISIKINRSYDTLELYEADERLQTIERIHLGQLV